MTIKERFLKFLGEREINDDALNRKNAWLPGEEYTAGQDATFGREIKKIVREEAIRDSWSEPRLYQRATRLEDWELELRPNLRPGRQLREAEAHNIVLAQQDGNAFDAHFKKLDLTKQKARRYRGPTIKLAKPRRKKKKSHAITK